MYNQCLLLCVCTHARTTFAVTATLVVWTVCLEDGRQFIAEWREHLPSRANVVIIYSRALAFFPLLLHPFAIHHSSKAWGIIFAEEFILCLPFDGWMHTCTYTLHAAIFVKSKSNLVYQRLNNWCVMLKKGWNNHRLLDIGGTSNPELELGRVGALCIWDGCPLK